jgi:mRNA interferase MazF
VARYTPDCGDIVWLHFEARGHEQAERRPAFVISPKTYNGKVGLGLFCPITTKVKGYPFEVEIPPGSKARGAILCDQIKSLDWRIRRVERLCPAPAGVLDEVTAKLLALIDPE